MNGSIRAATTNDAQAVADIYAPYVRDTVISFEETPPSASEMADRIVNTLKTHPFLVFDDGGRVVGYAYAGAHAARPAYRWSVDTTVYVAERAHGMGVGRSLYGALFDLLTRQGFHSAFAGIALPNEKSVRLHGSFGFVHLGTYEDVGFKHGAWRDVGWWRRPLVGNAAISEPVPFPLLDPKVG